MMKEREQRPAKIHRAVISEGRLYFGFRATRLFFEKALEDISQNPPNLPRQAQPTWERDLAITTAYIETDQTLQEVADQQSLTRQRIEQLIKDTLSRLHTYSSPKTKLLFPSVEWLTFPKPLSQRSRERISAVQGGASLQAARMLAEGKDIKEIMEETGSSTQRLTIIRRTLEFWGQKLPYTTDKVAHHQLYPELAQKLRDETLPDQEVARLLDRVDRYFYKHYAVEKDNPPIITVRTLARQADLHIGGGSTQDLVSALRDFGIPVKLIVNEIKQGPQKGVQTYYVVAASSKKRAQEAFLEHPNLQKYKEHPVQRLYGPPLPLPTTTELANKRGYEPLSYAFTKMGMRIRKNPRIKLAQVLQACPVAIFKYGAGYFYPSQQQDELIDYLSSKLTGTT